MTNETASSRFKIKYRITSTIGRLSMFIILFYLFSLRPELHWVNLVLGMKMLLVFTALLLISGELEYQLFKVRAIGLSKQGVVLYDSIGAIPPVPYDQVFKMEHAIDINGLAFKDKQMKNFSELVAMLPPEVLEAPQESHSAEEKPKKNRWSWLKYVGNVAFMFVFIFVDDLQVKGWLGAAFPFSVFCYQVYYIAVHLLERRKANGANQIDQRIV